LFSLFLSQTDKIIPFGGSATPQDKPLKSIVGGKGVGLQEMSRIGIAVPPGFTLSTPLCQVFQEKGDLPQDVWEAVEQAVARVEVDMGKKYGDSDNPLLFSCRSGAAVSMPGMMDTVSHFTNVSLAIILSFPAHLAHAFVSDP
jgi:pyruvate,orthophosphate dikinase